MKRVFLIVTLFSFLVTSTGVVVTQARCRITGTIMNSCCANDDGSCCTKEFHIVKIQDRYLLPAIHTVQPPELPFLFLSPESNRPEIKFLKVPAETGPGPPAPITPLSFLQVFLI